MNIQASRLQSALAMPASAAAARLATPVPAAAPASGAAAGTATTVTISQAAKDLLAQSRASVSLSSRAMDLIQRRNPFDSAPAGAPVHDSQQAQVRKLMDTLTTQHHNQQISTTQYQHDMAFYTRVATAIA
jgi:DNA-binding FadR family transcriptional regulator